MKMTLKILRWAAIVVVVLLLVDFGYIGVGEIYAYLTRNESEAQAAAEKVFHRFCQQKGIDPNLYQGPKRLNADTDTNARTYTFVWHLPPNDEFVVTVSYLPYELIY